MNIQTDHSTDATPRTNEPFEGLITQLVDLQHDVAKRWLYASRCLGNVHSSNRASARNLIHYLGLRCHDIRDLQNQLARNGISSLGRSESHVMSNLNKVLKLLHRILGRPYEPGEEYENALTLDQGSEILVRRTRALLGPQPKHRKVRIMVTLPAEASDDYELVRDLIQGGMDCARINGAHDTPDVWERMVANIEKAKTATGLGCRICFDIPGPKLRTGHFEPGPRVIKWRPERDALGNVIAPAKIWLTANEDPQSAPSQASAELTMPADFLRHLTGGNEIKFADARGSTRIIKPTAVEQGGVWLEANTTAYVIPETEFRVLTGTGSERAHACPGNIPALEQYAHLRAGDTVILTRSQAPGKPALIGSDGTVVKPARIPCTLPGVFDCVKEGERVWFDDGKLGGVISHVDQDEIQVEITRSGPKGFRLKGDKGINLPDSELNLPALTDTDRQILEFAVRYADLIGYSFVRRARDVTELQSELERMGSEHLGIILKIETRAAFENLPELLLASMKNPNTGVMIARGDLAVESGFERMAEVQEEILWMCEAAHMPVIWATQVLEQLSKKGMSSRAEITDAAMSERAECVMLNKGPFVVEAVRTLDNILTRMQSHQNKKRSMMRPLHLAERFFADLELNKVLDNGADPRVADI